MENLTIKEKETINSLINKIDVTNIKEPSRPRLIHKCRPCKSREVSGFLVSRCACGAINVMGYWMEKNTRRPIGRWWDRMKRKVLC